MRTQIPLPAQAIAGMPDPRETDDRAIRRHADAPSSRVFAGASVPVSSLPVGDLIALIFHTQMERINSVDKELRARLGVIQERNQRARELQAFLQVLREERKSGMDVDATSAAVIREAGNLGLDPPPQTVREFAERLQIGELPQNIDDDGADKLRGYNPATKTYTFVGEAEPMQISGEEWRLRKERDEAAEGAGKFQNIDTAASEAAADALIARVQDQLDAANNSNELEMIGLQRLMNLRNEALSLLSNVSRSDHEAAKAVIANIGG